MSVLAFERPLGASVADGRTTFRVWAPHADAVAVRVGGTDHPTADEGLGVHSVTLDAGHGDDYEVVLDGTAWPDPCSRWQPAGIRGPSRIVDPATLAADPGFAGLRLDELVLYELHVGAFTPEGTLDAAIDELPALAALGVTAVELMPVASFPGARGWGYDGVYLWAVHESYGGPEALARFVAAAHAAGLGVVLDCVYNHIGASGDDALKAFGPYFTDRYSTFWGEAINYDDAGSGAVREWVLQAAEGWVRDYGIDGLRLDAIHAIYDQSATPILAALAQRVHAADASALVIAESGLNDPRVIRPVAEGGLGHDAVWADEFHHALRVLLTDERDGYYEDFGAVADLAKALHRPYVHDGTWSAFRQQRYGAPADDRPPAQFVVFCANHDQVGNRAFGDRLPLAVRPLAALLTLLAPFTPMLFMGDEYGETAPFQFFADHIDSEIATATREGRKREFARFASFGHEIPDPDDPAVFAASKLTWHEAPGVRELHRAALTIRGKLTGLDAHEIVHDEDRRWLRFRRGEIEVVANFGHRQDVPVTGRELILATGPTGPPRDGAIALGRLTGAVLR